MRGLAFLSGDSSGIMESLAAALRGATVGAPDEAGREAVDILAVAAGIKPAAVIGFGGGDPAMLDAITEVAGRYGFVSQRCTAWTTRGELDAVPDWFSAAVVAARRRTPLVALSLLPDRLHPLQGVRAATLAPLTESTLLGYPTCCTAHHTEWRAAMHRTLADGIMAAAGGDQHRARRLAASGWTPTPRPGSRFAALLGRALAPHTAIVMCPDCFAFPTSPARRISAAFAALARQYGLDHRRDGPGRALPPVPAARDHTPAHAGR